MPRAPLRRRASRRAADPRQGDLFAWSADRPPPPRPAPAARAAPAHPDLARAQITGDYVALVRDLAGDAFPAIDRIFAGDRKIVYLVTDSGRRHVWHAWLAGPARRGVAGPEDFRRLLETGDRALLDEGWGPAPAGFRAALGRLGYAPAPAAAYRGLAALLAADPALARLLPRRDRLTPALIAALGGLRPETRPLLLECPEASLDEAADLLRRLDRAAAQARRAPDIAALTAALRAQASGAQAGGAQPLAPIRRAIARCGFPAPPLPAPAGAAALDSPEALASAARRFRNCIRDYAPDILRGAVYFYEWRGAGGDGAVVETRRRGGDWSLGQMLGPGNRRLGPRAEAAIAAAFGAAGFRGPLDDSIPF